MLRQTLQVAKEVKLMKVVFTLLVLLMFSEVVDASILDVFKDEQGRTKWQHVANFSGSVLILLLSFSLIGLTVSQFKLRSRNAELKEIKKNLEKTVEKRTENLNRSNKLLEGEIAEHKETASQLLSSQNYLQSILASMPSMLICLNNKMEITHWNKTAESITGLESQSVLGQNLWSAYPSITVAPEQIQSVLDDGLPKEIKHSQRGQYYFDITLYPLEGQSGVVVAVENVTQRSLAENMLIQRDKMASVGELASTMAHDISIPLQGILDDVQDVYEQLTSQKQMPQNEVNLLLDAIERGKQASAVVKNLLDFSGFQGTEKHSEDITKILDHCIDLGNDTLSEANGLRFRDIEIERIYAEGLPAVQCYSGELQQVFLSLFRHACHSMAGKKEQDYKPKITIEVLDAYDNVWVKVQHNGVGLTPEEQCDIFEPFVQHTTPANPRPVIPENRLSFSYFIVTEHHQGEMAVTSDIEVGTTFHIQFVTGN